METTTKMMMMVTTMMVTTVIMTEFSTSTVMRLWTIPPQKSEGKGKMPATFHIVVDSPPQPPPKQHLCTNEAGDSINVSDLGRGEGQDWVATGKVCEH